MKKAPWIVWMYALLFNGYATWIWSKGMVLTGSGVPNSLSTFAVFLGPMVSFIALLYLPWVRPGHVLSKG